MRERTLSSSNIAGGVSEYLSSSAISSGSSRDRYAIRKGICRGKRGYATSNLKLSFRGVIIDFACNGRRLRELSRKTRIIAALIFQNARSSFAGWIPDFWSRYAADTNGRLLSFDSERRTLIPEKAKLSLDLIRKLHVLYSVQITRTQVSPKEVER